MPGTNAAFPNKGNTRDAKNKSSNVKGETNVSFVGVQSNSISSKNVKQTTESQVSDKDKINVEKMMIHCKVIKNISDLLKLHEEYDDCSST